MPAAEPAAEPVAEPAAEPAAEDDVAAPASDASADGKHDPLRFTDYFTVYIFNVMQVKKVNGWTLMVSPLGLDSVFALQACSTLHFPIFNTV